MRSPIRSVLAIVLGVLALAPVLTWSGRAQAQDAQPSALPSLHIAHGAWKLSWASGFALHYAFVPRFSKANLTYAPDFGLRSHMIKLTATFYFF